MKRNFKPANSYTLVEMLVIIGVIAILVALLFPALRNARDQAKRTACLNNLKQISLGVRLYGDDSNEAAPSSGAAAAAHNILPLYSGYKAFIKSYVGLQGPSSARDKLFACPADAFYPAYVLPNAPTWQYVRQSLHDQSICDFSSYVFNGGDNVTRMAGTNAWTPPGLTGVKLSSVKYPSRTVLVAEASALAPWSWHEPSSSLLFADAKNMVSFVDGHVSCIKIYWDSTPLSNGGLGFALGYNPPGGYEYQWSAD